MKKMYMSVGNKIMVLAQIFGVVCLAAMVCLAVSVLAQIVFVGGGISSDVWICLIVFIGGILSSWLLYGFGQLVSDVNAIRQKIEGASEVVSDELPEL